MSVRATRQSKRKRASSSAAASASSSSTASTSQANDDENVTRIGVEGFSVGPLLTLSAFREAQRGLVPAASDAADEVLQELSEQYAVGELRRPTRFELVERQIAAELALLRAKQETLNAAKKQKAQPQSKLDGFDSSVDAAAAAASAERAAVKDNAAAVKADPGDAEEAAPLTLVPVTIDPNIDKKLVWKSSAVHVANVASHMVREGLDGDTSDVVRDGELVLTVLFFLPNRGTQRICSVDVLGSQTLTDLAAEFECPAADTAFAACDTGNQCMFIEGTFYDDMREREHLERYSTPMIEWLKQCGDRLPQGDIVKSSEARVADMDKTAWHSLTVRLHAPYLYMHLGDCQHVFAIDSVRLASASDPRRRSAYPRIVQQVRTRRRKCRICDKRAAEYITLNDTYAPENPCLFCKVCYEPLHYDEKGFLQPNNANFGGAEYLPG